MKIRVRRAALAAACAAGVLGGALLGGGVAAAEPLGQGLDPLFGGFWVCTSGNVELGQNVCFDTDVAHDRPWHHLVFIGESAEGAPDEHSGFVEVTWTDPGWLWKLIEMPETAR